MNVRKKLSLAVFLISMTILLVFGTAAAFGLKFFLDPNRPKGLLTSGTVTSKPTNLEFTLSSPDDNLLVYDGSILVQGKTSPHSTVLVGMNKDNLVVETGSTGDFSSTVKLESGLNKLTVAAFDSQGNSKRERRTVYYSTEKL